MRDRSSARCTGSATISSCSTSAASRRAIDAAAARALADRHTRDRLRPADRHRAAAPAAAQAFMRILNADGSEAEACGNGDALRRRADRRGDRRAAGARSRPSPACSTAELLGGRQVAVDMGRRAPTGATSRWRARWTRSMSICSAGRSRDPVCTNMGNPHATFFVADAEAIDLAALGPGARARPAVSRARQYRRRAMSRAEPHPAAGLGARRRDHPRLRQRRLRGAGGGAPPRPQPGARADGRRSTAASSTSCGATTATC